MKTYLKLLILSFLLIFCEKNNSQKSISEIYGGKQLKEIVIEGGLSIIHNVANDEIIDERYRAFYIHYCYKKQKRKKSTSAKFLEVRTYDESNNLLSKQLLEEYIYIPYNTDINEIRMINLKKHKERTERRLANGEAEHESFFEDFGIESQQWLQENSCPFACSKKDSKKTSNKKTFEKNAVVMLPPPTNNDWQYDEKTECHVYKILHIR